MSLRTRLLLGYGYLVALLLLTATGAALAFHHLATRVDHILRENAPSVRSGTVMVEALERQDSATLAILLGDEGAGADLEAAGATFAAGLEQAAGRQIEPDEETLLRQINERHLTYVEARTALLAARPAAPLDPYKRDVFPAFAAVKSRVLDLVELNHRAMRDADVAARTYALRAGAALAMLAAAALLSLGFLSRRLQRDLLGRLAEMQETAEAIAGGDRRRRVRASGNDELALVGRQLNAALETQMAEQGRSEGRFQQQRQLLLALLDRWAEPVAIVGLDGALVASTLDEERTMLVVVAEDAIGRRGRQVLSRAEDPGELAFDLHIGEARLRVVCLAVEGRRPVGWLVRVEFPSEE